MPILERKFRSKSNDRHRFWWQHDYSSAMAAYIEGKFVNYENSMQSEKLIKLIHENIKHKNQLDSIYSEYRKQAHTSEVVFHEFDSILKNKNLNHYQYYKQTIAADAVNPYTIMALYLKVGNNYVLDVELDMDLFKIVKDSLKKNYPDNFHITELENRIEAIEIKKQTQNKIEESLNPGNLIKNISGINPNEGLIDLSKIDFARRTSSSYRDTLNRYSFDYTRVLFKLRTTKIYDFETPMDQTPFVPKLDLQENFEKIAALQENALIKRMKHIKAKRIIVGVSGGLDSTLALLIAVRVYDLLGLPRKDIVGVTMPGLHTSDTTKNHAHELMKHLGVSVKEIDIKEHTKAHFSLIEHDGKTQDITYENTQARIRTTILMNLANKEQGIVLGTGDLSELVLGWCTYSGDQMSMYGINSGIPKTLVRFMIQEYALFKFNEEIRHILEGIVKTPITPELTENQTTEATIGRYEVNDFMIHRLFRFGDDEARIVWLLEKTFELSPQESEEYAHQFFTRFYSQQFKRQALPDGPKILDIGISPRGDLRLPSDIDYSF